MMAATLAMAAGTLFVTDLPACAPGCPIAWDAGARNGADDGARSQQDQNGRQQNGGKPRDEIAKLRADLRTPGADGRVTREGAVERLLGMPESRAHVVLSQELQSDDDPDGVRATILRGLERHLLAADAQQFGGAPTEVREQIFGAYLRAVVRWWGDDRPERYRALRRRAREALMLVPVLELERVAGQYLAVEENDAPALFACIADLQNLYLGRVIANQLENDDARIQRAARAALRLLTFRETDFEARQEFMTWLEQNSDTDYTDLAEQAARSSSRRVADVLRQRDDALVMRSRDVVLAYADSNPVNWSAIRKEVLVADQTIAEACLDALRGVLADRLPPVGTPARHEFCKGLLTRWRNLPANRQHLRALLLEVAAYVTRPDETELATEIQNGLILQLDRKDSQVRLAALRGLRRFPSTETRRVIVAHARRAVDEGAPAVPLIEAALAALSARTPPRWFAPGPDDPDKQEWIDLVRAIWLQPTLANLRDQALTLALAPAAIGENGAEQRVPEVFDLLLKFAQDVRLDSRFRVSCIFGLRTWNYAAGIERRHAALAALLADAEVDVRLQAASSLGKLHKVRPAATVEALRTRLAEETQVPVYEALVEALIACGREPQMPEVAIGAIRTVLADLRQEGALPEAHLFRQQKLLPALFQIAGERGAADGPWLAACDELLAFEERTMARDLLGRIHSAIDLAGNVESADGRVASRARWAMQLIIRTALLKPADVWWGSSEELKSEANEVHIAFGTLNKPKVPASDRLDGPEHRVLFLEVELVGSNYGEVVERAGAWLAERPANAPNGAAAAPTFRPEQKDRIRLLAADAQLGLSKPAQAAVMLKVIDPKRRLGPRELTVFDRAGRALLETDPATAVALLDRARQATATDDPAFRQRLLEWASAALTLDPNGKNRILTEVEKHAALFTGEDCPADLRKRFQSLRGTG